MLAAEAVPPAVPSLPQAQYEQRTQTPQAVQRWQIGRNEPYSKVLSPLQELAAAGPPKEQARNTAAAYRYRYRQETKSAFMRSQGQRQSPVVAEVEAVRAIPPPHQSGGDLRPALAQAAVAEAKEAPLTPVAAAAAVSGGAGAVPIPEWGVLRGEDRSCSVRLIPGGLPSPNVFAYRGAETSLVRARWEAAAAKIAVRSAFLSSMLFSSFTSFLFGFTRRIPLTPSPLHALRRHPPSSFASRLQEGQTLVQLRRRVLGRVCACEMCGIGKPEKIVDQFAFNDARREAKLVRLVAACATCAEISGCCSNGGAAGAGDSAVSGAYRRIACAHDAPLSDFRPQIQRMFAVRARRAKSARGGGGRTDAAGCAAACAGRALWSDTPPSLALPVFPFPTRRTPGRCTSRAARAPPGGRTCLCCRTTISLSGATWRRRICTR